MAADRSSGRSPWLVPILVAMITAAGAIAVAVISSQDNGPTTTSVGPGGGGTVTSTEPGTSAPNIEGDYYLDPDNRRAIVLKSVGIDRYSIQEQLPAPWPFSGTLEWTSHGRFDGTATFDSGSRMRVTLEPMSDGTLLTSFDFITDDQGVSIERVDEHVLVPVN